MKFFPGAPGGAIIDLDPEIVGGRAGLEGGLRELRCRHVDVLRSEERRVGEGRMTAAAVGRGMPETVGGDRIAIAVRSREQLGGRTDHILRDRLVSRLHACRMPIWRG